MRMLHPPSRPPISFSRRLPGGFIKSSIADAKSTACNRRAATRAIAAHRRLVPVRKTASVSSSANERIMLNAYRNTKGGQSPQIAQFFAKKPLYPYTVFFVCYSSLFTVEHVRLRMHSSSSLMRRMIRMRLFPCKSPAFVAEVSSAKAQTQALALKSVQNPATLRNSLQWRQPSLRQPYRPARRPRPWGWRPALPCLRPTA